MTREEVMAGRKNGIRYFDDAVMIKGRENLLQEALEIYKEDKKINEEKFPNMFKGISGTFKLIEAIKLVVKKTTKLSGSSNQTWNLDEILTKNEFAMLFKECGITSYTPLHKRDSS